MRMFLFLLAAFIVGAIELTPSEIALAEAAPSPIPAPSHGFATPALPAAQGLAPLELRLANAKSVKVQTSILGLELGSTLEEAHAKLDKLKDPAQAPKEEKHDSD